MKSEILQLSAVVDQAGALTIVHALNAIKGVGKVAVAGGTASINIDFDTDLTSLQELQAVVQKAGFGTRKAAHGEAGMCCGSCGG